MSKLKRSLKKETKKLVIEKLDAVFNEYKEGVKEKKYQSALKKASKLFVGGIVKPLAAKEPVSAKKGKASKKAKKEKAVKPDATEAK